MHPNFLIGMLVAWGLLAAGLILLARQRRSGRALYRARLLEAVADGVITQEEFAELESLRERHEVGRAEARMAALAAYRRALGDALADAELSPEEDHSLQRLQEQLGLSHADLGDDLTQLCRARLLARITAGELPHADLPGIQLVAGEQGHWFVRATFAERVALGGRGGRALRTVAFAVDDGPFTALGERDALRPSAEILPSDMGVLAVTSRRVVFQGARRTISIPHARLIAVALYADGVRLEEASGTAADAPAIARYFLVDDAELTAATALHAARQRRAEIRPATHPSRTA